MNLLACELNIEWVLKSERFPLQKSHLQLNFIYLFVDNLLLELNNIAHLYYCNV